jgi:hypothetical protein
MGKTFGLFCFLITLSNRRKQLYEFVEIKLILAQVIHPPPVQREGGGVNPSQGELPLVPFIACTFATYIVTIEILFRLVLGKLRYTSVPI